MVQRKMNNLWKAALSLYFQWRSVSFPVTISDECHRERLARRRMCSDLSHPFGISCLWLSCFGSPSPRLQSHGWRQKQHRKTGASTNNQTLPFEAQSKEWWSESTANLRPLRSNFEELRRQTVCKTGCYILQEISSACDLMVILRRQKNQQSNPWDNLWISELVKIFTESLTETVRNDLLRASTCHMSNCNDTQKCESKREKGCDERAVLEALSLVSSRNFDSRSNQWPSHWDFAEIAMPSQACLLECQSIHLFWVFLGTLLPPTTFQMCFQEMTCPKISSNFGWTCQLWFQHCFWPGYRSSFNTQQELCLFPLMYYHCHYQEDPCGLVAFWHWKAALLHTHTHTVRLTFWPGSPMIWCQLDHPDEPIRGVREPCPSVKIIAVLCSQMPCKFYVLSSVECPQSSLASTHGTHSALMVLGVL